MGLSGMDHPSARNKFIKNLYLYPHILGHILGKTKLNIEHSKWTRYLWLPDQVPDVNGELNTHRSMQGHRGSFKDIDINEPVLTPNGFVPHGLLKKGDEVYTPKGETVRVAGVSEVFQNKCYKITFSDGHEITCGEGHLWEVGEHHWHKKRRRRKYVVKTTEEISKYRHQPDHRLSVKLVGPLRMEKKQLLIPPYVLGAWLGDGHSEGGRITGHEDDVQIINEIQKEGYHISSMFRDKRRETTCTYGIKDLTTKLKELGVRKNKHIPEVYQQASIEQRRSLLQGLMDTDGSCGKAIRGRKGGNAVFVSKDENLAKDVLRLARSLGLAPRFKGYTYYFKNLKRDYTFYQVSFRAYRKDKPFRLLRKLARCSEGSRLFKDKYILSVEPVETIKTNCIKVDSAEGLYLVGKELTITHNTTAVLEVGPIWYLLFYPDTRIGILRKTFTDAANVVRTIRYHYKSDVVKELYTYIHGKPYEILRDSDSGILLSFKKSVTKEVSIGAHGLDGSITGTHYDKVFGDDLITLKDRISPAERVRTVGFIQEVLTNIIDPGKFVAITGTPWHKDDAWSMKGMPTPLKYDCYAEPRILTDKELQAKKDTTTSVLFAINYELKHIASEDAIFKDPEIQDLKERWPKWKNAFAQIDLKYSGDCYGAWTIAMKHGADKHFITGELFEDDFSVLNHIGISKVAYRFVLACTKRAVKKIFVETNADKGFGAGEIRKAIKKMFDEDMIDYMPMVEDYYESTNKDVKIQGYGVKYWGKCVWEKKMEDNPYLGQIVDYRDKEKPNDAPDSFASLFGRMYHKSQYHNIDALYTK